MNGLRRDVSGEERGGQTLIRPWLTTGQQGIMPGNEIDGFAYRFKSRHIFSK